MRDGRDLADDHCGFSSSLPRFTLDSRCNSFDAGVVQRHKLVRFSVSPLIRRYLNSLSDQTINAKHIIRKHHCLSSALLCNGAYHLGRG